MAADSSFALAHLELSKVLSPLGFESRAREEGKRAFDLSGGLPRKERLKIFVLWKSRESTGRREVNIVFSNFTAPSRLLGTKRPKACSDMLVLASANGMRIT